MLSGSLWLLFCGAVGAQEIDGSRARPDGAEDVTEEGSAPARVVVEPSAATRPGPAEEGRGDAGPGRGPGSGSGGAVPEPSRPRRPIVKPRLSIYLRPDIRMNPGFQAGQQDTEAAIFQRVRAGVRAERGLVTAVVDLQEVRSWGHRESSTSTEASVLAYQGYAQVGEQNRWFRAGRQELHMLNGFYMSKGPWSPSGRSFDAMRARWEGDHLTVDAFSALLEPPRPRSDEQSKPTNGDTLSAVFLTHQSHDVWESTLFAMLSTGGPTVDEPERKKVWVAPAFRLYGTPGLTKLDLNAMLQLGKDTDVPISTYDVILRFDQGFELAGSPGIALMFEQASGSGPNDNKIRDFDLHFGRNHYLRGNADQVHGENIRWFGFEVNSKPWESVKPVLQAHVFQLTNPEGVWRRNSSVEQGIGAIPRNSDPNLGVELDAIVLAHVDKHVKLDGGYTFFQPIGVGADITGSDPQHALYVRSRFSF